MRVVSKRISIDVFFGSSFCIVFVVYLETREWQEHLFQGCARQVEVLDFLFFQQIRQNIEHSRQLCAKLRKCYLVGVFHSLSSILQFGLWREGSVLQGSLHEIWDVTCFDLLLVLLDSKGVTVAIRLFKVARSSVHDKSSVNHDCDVVTKLLGFIHSMRCQESWWVVQFFHHT